MTQKVYSLAFTNHIKPVKTEVSLFTSLGDAHNAMKSAFDEYLAHIPTEKTCLCDINKREAYITDEYFSEDYNVDWTIEEQELEIELKFN